MIDGLFGGGVKMSFIGELKRRNVIRVALLYFVAAWLLLQLTDVLSSLLPVPEWTGSLVFLLLLIGLPPALIFAWVYEMTPEGIKREKDIDRDTSITPQTGKKINFVIVALLVLAIGGMVVDRLLPEKPALPVAADETVSEVGETDGGTPRNSIAVLPFADLSEDGDQQFFTDGLSEELLNLLVRVDGLRVASRTSAFAFRDSSLGVPQIAQTLGVAHVLEGSVRKSGDRIRVTAQLIEAETDHHLWSDNYDRNLEDIFAIQDEIGKAIVDALKDELGLRETSIEVSAVTNNMDAYALYLEAREKFLRRADLLESIELFTKAVELDPDFARAWEGLAAVEMVTDDWVFDDGVEHAPRAVAAAERALSIDPSLSMPYAVLGLHSHDYSKDSVKSEELYRKAIELDPKNTTAWLWFGIFMNENGFFKRGEEFLRNCIDIDPGYLNCQHHLTMSLLSQNRVEEALAIFEPTIASNFHSVSEVYVSHYVASGQPLVALLLAHAEIGDSSVPVLEWIKALENPNANHEIGYALLKDWERNKSSGWRLNDTGIILLPFGKFEEFADNPLANKLYIWLPEAAEFRKSRFFKEMVKKSRILEYWQERGFPNHCRALGDNDFECDELT
jgi:TolB-like protein/Tfp pilus assembly protein PilF